jgi:hypothetical protein
MRFGSCCYMGINASYFTFVKPLKSSKFWLTGIAAGLVAIHLNVTFRLGELNLLSMSALFWLVVSSLVWRKHNSLSLESGVLASCLGATLIAALLLKITAITGGHFIRLFPFVCASRDLSNTGKNYSFSFFWARQS